MSTKTILLDLDGVLVNFHKRAFPIWKCSPSLEDYPIECGWDILDALNFQRKKRGFKKVEPKQFWNRFDTHFWATLPWYRHAKNFLKSLEDIVGQENIILCTSAAYDSSCAAGKVEWITRELPAYRRQYFIGCQKFRLAKPDVLLIDDADHNVLDFREHDGKAVLFPRPWNWYKDARSQEPYEQALELVELLT